MNVGPFLGFLINAKTEIKGDGFETITSKEKSFLTNFNLGHTAAFGVLVPIEEKSVLFFEVRNNLGITCISYVPAINDDSLKINSLNLIFGLTYKL